MNYSLEKQYNSAKISKQLAFGFPTLSEANAIIGESSEVYKVLKGSAQELTRVLWIAGDRGIHILAKGAYTRLVINNSGFVPYEQVTNISHHRELMAKYWISLTTAGANEVIRFIDQADALDFVQIVRKKIAEPKIVNSTPSESGATKTCPDCAEEIKAEAVKCRFCGYRYGA